MIDVDQEQANKTSLLNVCFIGKGSHASRIKNILSNINIDFNFIDHDRSLDINQQLDVANADIIFITSPNNTHIHYLRQLVKDYEGYVYCEKPPINKFEDLEIFELINPSKFFFGFNHRYSEIQKFILQIKETHNIGDLININIHMSYPFSVKESYKHSWKSDANKSLTGVIENLGIHYLDLSVNLLGGVKEVFINSTNINNTGTAEDTASLSLIHKNDSTAQIFVSYATLARESMYFSFERAGIEYNGIELNAYYPRESYNCEGLSVTPPIVLTKSINSELLQSKSLKNCIDYFINTVLRGESFEHDLLKKSRITTLAMFGEVEN